MHGFSNRGGRWRHRRAERRVAARPPGARSRPGGAGRPPAGRPRRHPDLAAARCPAGPAPAHVLRPVPASAAHPAAGRARRPPRTRCRRGRHDRPARGRAPGRRDRPRRVRLPPGDHRVGAAPRRARAGRTPGPPRPVRPGRRGRAGPGAGHTRRRLDDRGGRGRGRDRPPFPAGRRLRRPGRGEPLRQRLPQPLLPAAGRRRAAAAVPEPHRLRGRGGLRRRALRARQPHLRGGVRAAARGRRARPPPRGRRLRGRHPSRRAVRAVAAAGQRRTDRHGRADGRTHQHLARVVVRRAGRLPADRGRAVHDRPHPGPRRVVRPGRRGPAVRPAGP